MEFHLSISFCFLLSLSILLPTAQGEQSEDPWRQKSSADCWGPCGSKGGACPSFCGKDAYCCRRGYGDCPVDAAEASRHYHTCVTQEFDPKGLWWQAVMDGMDDANCLENCGGKGGVCDSGFCGRLELCCKEGSGECPPEAEKVSPTEYTCVTQTGPWVQNKGNIDCLVPCGAKGGACPSFCGSAGYCCRRGFGDCPADAAVASPHYHTCVTPFALWMRYLRNNPYQPPTADDHDISLAFEY